jgi:membrane protein DedA with SNARE-associated domain/rhodanese-related sulfurtransferase
MFMKEAVHFLATHGYPSLVIAVLARQACLPVPASLVLLAAGALAGSGKLNFGAVVVFSVLAFVSADLAWFEAGRKWANRILHFACGFSKDPNSCVQRADRSFARYGVESLLISKFVLGLDAVTAPLAGASGTTRLRFLVFDALGALLWSAVYTTLGYVFSEQLERVAGYATRTGELIAFLLIAGLGAYVVLRLVRFLRFVREFRLARITPDLLQDKLSAGENILILDVQRNEKPDQKLGSIPGAVQVDPRSLDHDLGALGPMATLADREVVIYCSSPSEYVSARMALALRRKGFQHVWPLAGGLQAWRDRGFAVTAEIAAPRS